MFSAIIAENEESRMLRSFGVPPIVYDNASIEGIITKRLIILMKKAMKVIGDQPKLIAIDGAQFFDIDQIVGGREDYPTDHIKEDFNLEVTLIPRRFKWDSKNSEKSRFCVMVGGLGKIVIGTY